MEKECETRKKKKTMKDTNTMQPQSEEKVVSWRCWGRKCTKTSKLKQGVEQWLSEAKNGAQSRRSHVVMGWRGAYAAVEPAMFFERLITGRQETSYRAQAESSQGKLENSIVCRVTSVVSDSLRPHGL